jgi:hypothetical protein
MNTRSSHYIVGLAAAVVAGCLWVGTAAAGGLYKWVDKDGQTHYSEFPPPGEKAQALKPPPKVDTESAVDALKAKQEAFKKQDEAADKAKQAATKKSTEMQQKKQRCETARRDLERLQNAQRIYQTDKDGNRVRLGEDQRQAQIKEREKIISKDCQ